MRRNLKLEDAEFTWQAYDSGDFYFKYRVGKPHLYNEDEFENFDLHNTHRSFGKLDGTDKMVLSIKPTEASKKSFSINVFIEKFEVEKVEEFLSELDGIEFMMTCDHEFEVVDQVETWLGITDKHVCKYCGVKKFANGVSPDIKPSHI